MKEKKTPSLNSKQKKYLKGLGHHLSAVILVGKEGLTDNLIKATNKELAHNELIKVKVGNNSPVNKNEAADRLPGATESTLVQLIGKTVLLYKKNPKRKKDKRIILPG